MRTLVERVGAERLVWGTDMPFQNRFCTYRQSKDWIAKPDYCPFLTDRQRELILGGAAQELLGIDGPAAAAQPAAGAGSSL